MSINLRKVAQKSVTLAEIMEGRVKGTTEELIAKGKPVIINDCEVMNMKTDEGEERVWAFTIDEDDKKFFFAGTVMKNIFEDILTACEGDYAEMYSAVNTQHLVVQFKEGKTKKGRPITTVDVL